MNNQQRTKLFYPNHQIDKNRSYMKNLMLLFVLCFALVNVMIAQVPAPKQAGPIVVKGADIHTLTGNVIENGQILFENGVITEIGQSINYPDNTVIVEADGKYIHP